MVDRSFGMSLLASMLSSQSQMENTCKQSLFARRFYNRPSPPPFPFYLTPPRPLRDALGQGEWMAF